MGNQQLKKIIEEQRAIILKAQAELEFVRATVPYAFKYMDEWEQRQEIVPNKEATIQ